MMKMRLDTLCFRNCKVQICLELFIFLNALPFWFFWGAVVLLNLMQVLCDGDHDMFKSFP
jgi:hypothetical protein